MYLYDQEVLNNAGVSFRLWFVLEVFDNAMNRGVYRVHQ